MLELSNKTNLLEQKTYRYSLQDVEHANLYPDLFSYDEVPRVSFNHRRVPLGMPEEIWITDTTFRDGQQSIEPYTVKQIVDLALSGRQSFLSTARKTGMRLPSAWTWGWIFLRSRHGSAPRRKTFSSCGI